jgi:hypothetical protein
VSEVVPVSLFPWWMVGDACVVVKVGDWLIIGRAWLLAILGALARSSGCFVGVWVESVLWWDGSGW